MSTTETDRMPKPNSPRASALKWHQIGILYRREMLAAFRERTILINSILIPLFLYPFLLWLAFSALTFVSGQTEGFKPRVAVLDWPSAHPRLRHTFELSQDIELTQAPARKTD